MSVYQVISNGQAIAEYTNALLAYKLASDLSTFYDCVTRVLLIVI